MSDFSDFFWNKTVAKNYIQFSKEIESKGFVYIDSGGCRDVYYRGNFVIKIPNREAGVIDNIVEDAAWHQYKNKRTEDGLYLAPCRLLQNKSLMMVYVDIDSYEGCNPDWAEKVDGEQVGKYKHRFVAYDYALDVEVPEYVVSQHYVLLKENDYFR